MSAKCRRRSCDPKIIVPALRGAFAKLDPRTLIKNPVMFVVEVVAALTTIIFIRDLMPGAGDLGFSFQIILWLWFTILFANFAEAVAKGRGKAQAATLRQTRDYRGQQLEELDLWRGQIETLRINMGGVLCGSSAAPRNR